MNNLNVNISKEVRKEIEDFLPPDNENMIDAGDSFKKELADLLNSKCRENASNTPDFILAKYLWNCLTNFEITTKAREKWYGTHLEPDAPHFNFPGVPPKKRILPGDYIYHRPGKCRG